MKSSVGKRIYELRKEFGISQQKLASKIGVTQKAIDFWEKEINEPKASYVVKLSLFFNVSPAYLLGMED